MLTRFKNPFTPSTTPSALLIIGKVGATIHVLYLLPENDTIERFSLITPTSTTTFRHGGATEQAREQIGAVTLHIADGETADSFPDDVEARIRKLRNDSLSSSPAQLQIGSVEVTQLVQNFLQPAALDAIHEREERARSIHATQTYPVFIVHIMRSRARMIPTEPTSFP
ncbi:uncharacterized protein N7479_010264 [Penicillium vulpinum]|uniref:Uncharacterized protein n=1 Tax=Penicillium vulpinum TaxID=29845 RepID=A0A1V6RGI5_9EURO|nr:uncharacterized protein N7479_010264 [Penicillium vulpinum]KAJ5951851.1 hypothetical protein N7479_010264 [Penicillium vulpinum]OQE00604.1 hypothetical protein PENVUL_c049G07695 [Penicillium vulpinum]